MRRESFQEDEEDDATLIRERLEAGDLAGARVAAHTLKGGTGNLAAKNLCVVAGKLEEALKAGHPDEAARCLPELAELSQLLERRDLQAQELFAQVRPLLTASEPARTERLANAMEKLDFRQALTELEALAADISTIKEG